MKAKSEGSLYQALMVRRDTERERLRAARKLVKGKAQPWEDTPQGRMRWYLHPEIRDTAMRNLIICMLEVPPGSRTGRQKHQGGVAFYVLQGQGYTLIDGVRHDWEAGDCVLLPIRPEGVIHQHFNLDPERPARLLAAMENLMDALGVDMGCGLEQLEGAPEYRRND